MLRGVDSVLFGGDYNPEQWPEGIRQEDMRLFREAHVNTVTLNVFSWAMLQPSEEVYDFQDLDRIMEMVRTNGLKVIMATATAAHPAWMARKYPETCPVDKNGRRHRFGVRQNVCPNSSVFRKYARRLASKLAERYRDYDNIAAWHISNEYGTYCYCDTCQAKFRKWVKRRYGTIENVNAAWNMTFWGHKLYDWEDIVVPDYRSEEFLWDGDRTNFQPISLDYRRFMSDSNLENYRAEYAAVKEFMPDVPVTTNLMSFFEPLDYRKWARSMDFISWDNYPSYDQHPSEIALWHDVMRGLGGGKPFCLMEQTPGVSNWQLYCRLKRPGEMRMWSWQAVAHGADTVLFFQMRRSIGACEKYHSALIDHAGRDDTRVFREMASLGAELEALGNVTLGGRSDAETAIIFDWENWWAVSLSAGPTRLLSYRNEILTWYRYFYDCHIPVDLIGPDDSSDRYKVVIAPMLYMDHEHFSDRIMAYTAAGGRFVTTFFSGWVDDNDRVRGAGMSGMVQKEGVWRPGDPVPAPGQPGAPCSGYPSRWQDLLGVRVEETDALPPEMPNRMRGVGAGDAPADRRQERSDDAGGLTGSYECTVMCDLLRPAAGVEILAEYEREFYAGSPAVTRHPYGRGTAYYVGTHGDAAFYRDFLDIIMKECGIAPLTAADPEVEITERTNGNGTILYVINHAEEDRRVRAPYDGTELLSGRHICAGETVRLPSFGVALLQRS